MVTFAKFNDDFKNEMDELLTQDLPDLSGDNLKSALTKIPYLKILKAIVNLYFTLLESEFKLKTFIEHIEKNPVNGPLVLALPGRMEYGLILYWIQHPPTEVQNYLDKHEELQEVWEKLAHILDKVGLKPQITTDQYDLLIEKMGDNGVVAPDGTILGWGKYEQFDLNWLITVPYWFWNIKHPDDVHSFGTNAPFKQDTLTPTAGNNSITIGILGDWGTGEWEDHGTNGPAIDVLSTLQNKKPDYAIHLGDVYYAGTEDRPPSHEEMNNFLKLWKDFDAGKCFTLNSNHEMYGAAQGYFDVALKASGPFAHQNQKSYFALSNKDWVIIGLDSAYYTKTPLYMNGNIGGGTSTEQADFIKGLNTSGKKVIVLTHHNPIELDGTKIVTDDYNDVDLFVEVSNALGREPDFWYWGHVHDGVAYNNTTAAGSNMVGRCVGHSAIPYGAPWGLKGNNSIDYYAQTPDPIVQDIRVKNGFLIITLTGGTLTDAFYDQGNENAVWTK